MKDSYLNNTVLHLDWEALRKMGAEQVDEKGIYRGKVREVLDLGSRLLIFTSDRISAFDKVLSTIPSKGEILNKLSLFWFHETADIIQNHIIEEVSPRSVLVRKCKTLPIEVIVRGYLTGSAWRAYEKGEDISGYKLPEGMKMNQAFDKPLLTPTTKAEGGEHDMPITRDQILSQKLVSEPIWNAVEEAAMKLFQKGTEIANKQGLILVDTKYEFGISEGELYVVDEIHTQDSSRYWYMDSYQECFDKGEDQRKLDKEFFRKWLMDKNFMGDGKAPEITDEVRLQIMERYLEAYKVITGREFQPSGISPQEELELIAQRLRCCL
ncbi:MAG: phosphoribosylaminoimidazolesuccinocarboxamide synthase [Spirochaetales bacterium]|nr:phosphoribosylaminoimidazolesuccinocarboxamide synthase [Spirochaetales bacterium]